MYWQVVLESQSSRRNYHTHQEQKERSIARWSTMSFVSGRLIIEISKRQISLKSLLPPLTRASSQSLDVTGRALGRIHKVFECGMHFIQRRHTNCHSTRRRKTFAQQSIALCYVVIRQSDSPSPCQISKIITTFGWANPPKMANVLCACQPRHRHLEDLVCLKAKTQV